MSFSCFYILVFLDCFFFKTCFGVLQEVLNRRLFSCMQSVSSVVCVLNMSLVCVSAIVYRVLCPFSFVDELWRMGWLRLVDSLKL